ncbi:MAG TPA: hypothetical protein VMU90_14270 [Solirubrobacteraceae bacterium]|nr:hypothetical protein [Solirubrobacteraceae bacterium]
MPQGKGRTARRLRRGSMVCVTAVLGLAGPALACGETQQATPRQAPTNPPPLAVGDSVLADTVQLLAGAGYEANGMVCRTVDQGLAILRARGNQLPSLVVFALGTNGGITDSQVREALAILGPSRRLVLVTPHHGDDPNSPQEVRNEVNRYAPQTVLLDWDRLSSPHPEWFAPDGIHLGGDAGIHAFASMIISALPYATSGQVQAIPTPPPPPPPRPADAAPAPRHPPAVTVFLRAARAAARGVKPRPLARALPAIVLPVKPGPQAGVSIWVVVGAVAGALALALVAGLLGRRWHRRRQAVTPQPVVPAPAPPLATPAPQPPAAPAARAPVAKRRPGLVLAGAAVAALALAAVRTGRSGPDRRRR